MKSNELRIKQFGLFFIFLLTISTIDAKPKENKWCWTKSMANEPTFSLDPKMGGMNWGYCQPPKINGKQGGAESKYIAIIETSKAPQSETTSGIKIKLYGDLGVTDDAPIGSDFERGSTKKVTFTLPDVGKIQKIKLTLDGSQPYRCKKITIKRGAKTASFECLRKLEPCPTADPKGAKCNMKLSATGTSPYEITVKASQKEGSGTTAPILLAVIGKNGEGDLSLISDTGIADGGVKTVKVMGNDVGPITGFKLVIPEQGKLIPSMVRIKNINAKSLKVFEIKDIILTNPGKSSYSLVVNSNGGSATSSKPNPEEDKDEGEDADNPDGGQLSVAEKIKLVDLKCDQKMENPSVSNQIFGPEYPTNQPNYLNVLARCPANCHKLKSKVLGLGIHPSNTPICMAALVDNAISFYGGIINISVLPGLTKYSVQKKFKQKKGQNIKKFVGNVKKSFTVMKVDNVDLVEKDIRIVTGKGKFSNEGRIEVRREGNWGSICALDNNKKAAKRICKDLGYRDGEWKSPSDASAKNYCKSFNGDDHCGAKKSDIHFMAVKCTDNDKTFNKCHKLLADRSKCNHGMDAIIRCFNENYEKMKEIPPGVVRLQKSQAAGKGFIGRLEMFKKKDFLPICNLGFNNNSALIACKQMGYVKGVMVTGAAAKPFQMDIKSKTTFAAEKMICSGSESEVKECKYNAFNVVCKHDQDVVVKCSKGNGDPSGKSQYVKPVINPPPSLGKLKMAKFIVACEERGNALYFRGDPGSIYMIECPKNCGKLSGSSWGTGIYTSNSQICRSAVHSGIIQDEQGGTFVMERTHGIKYYQGSDFNNIITTQYVGQWPASITFSGLNSAWINMGRALKKSAFIALKDDINLRTPPARLDYYSSFVEASSSDLELPVPAFQYIPKDYKFAFTDKSNLFIQDHELGILNNFTILLSFKMAEFKKSRAYLFSYSGCNGFNIYIDTNNALIIGDPCNPSQRFSTGYMIPIGDKTLLYLKHKEGKVYLRIYSYTTKNIYERKLKQDLKFPAQGPIGIGRQANEKVDFFYGKIDFIQLYYVEVKIDLMDTIINSLKVEPLSGLATTEKTMDARKCVSQCTSNPIPGNPGAGKPPNEANPFLVPSGNGAKPSKGGSGSKGGNSSSGSGGSKGSGSSGGSGGSGSGSGSSGRAPGTFDKKQAGNLESTDINCQTNLNDKRFAGAPGKIFRVKCKNCMSERGAVFGTSIYHPLSSICKAASHAGALPPKKGGVFLLQIVVGAKAYNGSPGADKTTSATFAGANKSFIVMKAPPLLKINCKSSANQSPFSTASVSKKFVVLCPPGCSKAKAIIFGTDTYTDNSSICISAIHYGMLSDKGGEVSFIIAKGQNSYKKSRGFGIASKAKGAHIRSFNFIGNRAAIFYKWDEDYNDKLSAKWKVVVHPNAESSTSNSWSYVNDNEFVLDGLKQKMRAILHTGKISNKSPTDFGSWIHLKNGDWANGKIKFNFLMYDIKPFAVLFRYQDKDNYYALEFSAEGQDNVKFFKNVNGGVNMVGAKTVKLLTGKFYRVVIILDYDKIKIKLQSHIIRQHKMLFFKEVLNGLSRGSMGFATRGNSNLYLNGISVDEYKPNRKDKFANNKRSWHSLLKFLRTKQRKIFCNDYFNLMKEEIPRCMEIHNYCRIRCDKLISTVESILNFSCQRDCVRTANTLESKTDELSRLGKRGQWVPKPKEKIDFLPRGETTFRMAFVKSIERKEKKLVVTVEYLVDGKNTSVSEVNFPSNNLKRCGQALTARQDCMLK